MIKIVGIFIGIVLLTGCFGNMTPSEKAEDFLNRYIKNDKDILAELDISLDKQDLSNDQKQKYREVIKEEYSTLKYTIKDEHIDGNDAEVEVELNVNDLYKASKEASDYLIDNSQEFYTDDVYDEKKFIDYKLEKMENSNDRITYTIFFELKKKDGVWTIEDLDDQTLQKIHGIYDYETNNS